MRLILEFRLNGVVKLKGGQPTGRRASLRPQTVPDSLQPQDRYNLTSPHLAVYESFAI